MGVKTYPLDNSALLHLATRRKRYSNIFRIVVTLRSSVDATVLQSAVDDITPRFPTIIAGIHNGLFQYRVVPAKTPPVVQKECGCLVPMTSAEMKRCACRVLYSGKKIITEFFHSLTDGFGGMTVTNTLLSTYIDKKYAVYSETTDTLLRIYDSPAEEEVIDDYFTYATSKPMIPHPCKSYQLPVEASLEYKTIVSTSVISVNELVNAAHHYHSSVTAFLAAVMAESVMELQARTTDKLHREPIQIMIPINLRNRFPSRTLRNFALFALTGIQTKDFDRPFEDLLHILDEQLKEQTTQSYLSAMMTTHVKAARSPFFLIMPLKIKMLTLNLAHKLLGESNSCISLSNLGNIVLPEHFSEFIEGIDFALTPKIRSLYNCGVVSFDGVLSISFSRLCEKTELEEIFFQKLRNVIMQTKHDGKC